MSDTDYESPKYYSDRFKETKPSSSFENHNYSHCGRKVFTKRSADTAFEHEEAVLADMRKTWTHPPGQSSATFPTTAGDKRTQVPACDDRTQRMIDAKIIELDQEIAAHSNTHRQNESDYSKACAADEAAQEAAKAAAAEKGRALRKQTLSLEALRPLRDKKTKLTDLVKRRKELKEDMEKVDNEILKM